MAFINKHDTDGSKGALSKGELGFDDYPSGGDQGRVYVGDGTSNIPLSKKAELDAEISKQGGLSSLSFAVAQEIRKQHYDRSGFVEWGDEFSSTDVINTGMSVITPPNTNNIQTFYLGGTNEAARVNINGYDLVLRGTPRLTNGTTYDNGTPINMPFAPVVNHADSTNSGLVLNGDFSLGDVNWTHGTDWVISGGAASHTAGTGSNITQTIATTGVEYYIEVEIKTSNDTGIMYVFDGVDVIDIGTVAVGKYKLKFTAQGSTVGIRSNVDWAGELDNISIYPVAEVERTDLVMLEVWEEDTAEKGVVYPEGNVHWRHGDVDGLTGIADGVFAGADTYSLFGNWQTAGDLIGQCYTLSSLTDTQLAAFVANPDNNCYYTDDGKLIQVRYRVRTVEGGGDTWNYIEDYWPSDVVSALYSVNSDSYLLLRGSLTSAQDFELPGVNNSDRRLYTGGNANAVQIEGVFGSTINTVAHEGRCYAMPIATVKRLNQGAYHPVFNERGTTTLNGTDTAIYGWQWFANNALKPLSTIECFNPITSANTNITEVGYVVDSGFIDSGATGISRYARPDGKLYDAIYADQVYDLRLPVYKNWTVANTMQHLISGNARGEEGANVTSEANQIFPDAASALTLGILTSELSGKPIAIGSNVYHNGQSARVLYIQVSGANTVLNLSQPINRLLNQPVYVVTQDYAQNSGEMLHCDIIGDPAFYPKTTIDYTTTGASQVVSVVKGDKVFYEVASGSTGVGTVGNYYVAKVDQASIDLDTEDFTNTTNWIDTGNTNDVGWQESLADGYSLFGTPLLVGENGEDYIPDGTAKTYKFSKKLSSLPALILLSTDNGATWSNQTSGYNPAINLTSNSITNASFDVTGRLWMVFYTTKPETVEPVINTPVKDDEIGEVQVLSNYLTTRGNDLLSSLIRKVGVNGNAPNIETTALSSYAVIDGLLNDSTGTTKPTHVATTISSVQNEPTVKVLGYKTADGVNMLFKEIKHNGTSLGDDSQFDIADNVTTTTDDNAETILIGQKSVKVKSDLR